MYNIIFINYFLAVACDAIGKPCFCDAKLTTACDGIANSDCNQNTGSCDCDVNFHNDNGVCTLAPGRLFSFSLTASHDNR